MNFYKYGRQLGKGAFGKVNLALHLCSGKLVAIKSIHLAKIKSANKKNKLKYEIEIFKKMHHPFVSEYIIYITYRILDTFETDKYIFIVMEYICGDLLNLVRKRGKVPENLAKIIFKQIIEGLKYIHSKNIVHRDIKLDNILIDLKNTVKICDFGVSKIINQDTIMSEHCGI